MNPTYNSRHGTVVDQDIEWQPLETCRPGADVQLLTAGLVGIRGRYDPRDTSIVAWFPMPNVPQWAKDKAKERK